jgi:hypothetical protein
MNHYSEVMTAIAEVEYSIDNLLDVTNTAARENIKVRLAKARQSATAMEEEKLSLRLTNLDKEIQSLSSKLTQVEDLRESTIKQLVDLNKATSPPKDTSRA